MLYYSLNKSLTFVYIFNMKRGLFNLMWCIALIAASFTFLTHDAKAMLVSPVVIEHEMSPGESVSGKMRVTNTADQPQTYYTIIQKFVAVGERGKQEFLEEDDVMGLPSWFDIKDSRYNIATKETAEIEYTITAPPNAEPGGHYVAVFFTTTPPEDIGETSGAGITSKTGILVLVTIAGDIIEKAEIETFDTSKKVFGHLPAYMSLRIRNSGNIHIRPSGTIEIRNMWGGIVAKIPANPNNSAVLPNSIRRLDTWWAKSNKIAKDAGFFKGLYNEWNNFAVGRYTAVVNVKTSNTGTAFEAQEASFWVIPWRMITVLVSLLVILFIIMKFYNKAIVSSAIKKSSKKK
jgi:hypothetical protein